MASSSNPAVTSKRRWRRRGLQALIWTSVFVVVVTTVLFAILILPVIPDPTTSFVTRKGEFRKAYITKEWIEKASRYYETTLTSTTGLRVDLTVRTPLDSASPRPLVMLLGGYRTGRHAAKLFSDTQGVVVAALSYPYQSNIRKDGFGLLLYLPKIQQALIDTTPAVLLALDYLVKQPYVAPSQVELVGVSLGAFFVSIPGALDQRIRRVWLIHGAGDPAAIFEYRLNEKIAYQPLRRLTAKLIAILSCSHHLKPERWVGQISPRPVIVVNARDDEAFPPSSVAVLHQSLYKPFEIIWTKGEHIRPSRNEVVQQLATLVLKRISQENKE